MRRIVFIVALLLTLTLVGTIGFHLLTGEPWLDCVYQAIITLTTVGSREPDPLSDRIKLFIICYLIFGLGVFSYSALQLGQAVFSFEMRSLIERRRMQNAISKLKDHFIVCGHGRMGETICHYLHDRNRPFVAVDIVEEHLIQLAQEHGWLYLHGDATDDQVLINAGIKQARSLASVLPTDADNVYVALSARMLNSNMQIIARASDEKAVEKLERAGASRVVMVSPFSSGAEKMARFMLNPSIEDFLEIADAQGNELELADVLISEHSPYVGKRLMETDLSEKGVMVIGIRRSNGERLMPPPSNAVIHPGDSLFAFGSTAAVNEMIDEADAKE
jgi:voltage-gated potassium channel